MPDQAFARGVLLACCSLFFGLAALRYPVGDLAHAGPGLFPLVVSGALFGLATIMIVRSRFRPGGALRAQARSIVPITVALLGFVALSRALDMAAGIVFLVVVAGIAGSRSSWPRKLQISAALVAIAFLFQAGLGLNLGLFR